MTKTSNKNAKTTASPLFVFGLDENGKPRGARFPNIQDDIVSAAIDMKCQVVSNASAKIIEIGVKLPLGRIYASGKAFIPNIRRELYDKLLHATREVQEKANIEMAEGTIENAHTTQRLIAKADIALGQKAKGGLPRDFDSIGVGDMVLFLESPDDGWWEAIVTERDQDILTLRYRDYPKDPTFIRHISTIARVYPGPF